MSKNKGQKSVEQESAPVSPDGGSDHDKIELLIEENKKLIEENNKMIKKLYCVTAITFWVRIAWYVLLIGLPFALYFYLIEPYFEAFGSNYQVFVDGLNELPGLKGIKELMGR